MQSFEVVTIRPIKLAFNWSGLRLCIALNSLTFPKIIVRIRKKLNYRLDYWLKLTFETIDEVARLFKQEIKYLSGKTVIISIIG